jgi:hypothetical protein
MDESRRIPVSQRMWCATLHPHPSAPLPPTARTSRRLSDGAGPFGDPPGQGSRNRVRFVRSGADEVDPRREPSRSAQNHHQGPRSRTATSPDLPSALQQGLSHPRETRDRPWPNTPPHSARRVAPRSGQTAWRPLATAAPIKGIDHTTMSKPTMTTTTPGLPMARAHPSRGASPWPTLPRSGQGPHATATAPSCPLPRRTAGIPGRPAPTWEELLGQR